MEKVNILKTETSVHTLISNLSQQLNICMASDNLQRMLACIISFDLRKKYSIMPGKQTNLKAGLSDFLYILKFLNFDIKLYKPPSRMIFPEINQFT